MLEPFGNANFIGSLQERDRPHLAQIQTQCIIRTAGRSLIEFFNGHRIGNFGIIVIQVVRIVRLVIEFVARFGQSLFGLRVLPLRGIAGSATMGIQVVSQVVSSHHPILREADCRRG